MNFKYALLIAVGLACFSNNAFAARQYSQEEIDFVTQKANKGDAASQEVLGEIYQTGDYGPEKDPFAAKDWYEKAVQLGDVNAMNNLANMYRHGDGVPQDYAKAIELLKKADSLGNKKAAFNIAVMYEDGEGVPKNISTAMDWYKKAANNGNSLAMNNLGVNYHDGLDVTKNINTAKEYFKQACLHKNPKGCENYKKLNNQ
ncbi:unnamed protein product [Commensalibacter communis]|uniref:Sel1 repeat family protein n=1 Tax=Commensalibacter communis TaxID=2972786 RepID=A0A9W4TQA0_9PROT|nr:tetratricopeptide repeat protein [Commensalibacter communis]CAI3950557.1 unnamed protein product [Commensalibacter communis]CAI3952520.1 unnamed protein product [Commensalibacter communis]CAI3954655.1 unnamed protein product [Commensalibacter communis]CAI3955112.1 unnamed protein product [Commensalibacter communis]